MTDVDDNGRSAFAVSAGSDANGDPVLVLSGELDLAGVAELEAAVEQATLRTPERLVFDVADLRFIDSAGMAVLVSAASKASEVCLRKPSAAVQRIVQVTGLSDILAIDAAS